jgi:pilus assembly protein Flp/PilA
MRNIINRFRKDEAGVTAIEYGLIAALVAVVIIAALTTLGGQLTNTFNSVAGAMAGA